MTARLRSGRWLVAAGVCFTVSATALAARPALAQGHLAATVVAPARTVVVRTVVAATLPVRVLPDSEPEADDVDASSDDLLAPGSGMTIVDRFGHDLREPARDTVPDRARPGDSVYARTGSAARGRPVPITPPPSTAPPTS